MSSRVVVTGASGLIGTALVAALRGRGDEVVTLVRRPPGPGEARWDPTGRGRSALDPAALSGAAAVVHLAGAGLADRRWNAARKKELVASRVSSTRLLAEALAGVAEHPCALLSASAIGYYGDRGDEVLDESAAPGSGFLADLCRRWEEATAPAQEAAIRVAHLRTGVVLARRGGALGRQLPLFRAGLGGRLGTGRQWLSWIGVDDEVGAILHVLDGALSGAVNLTAPQPVTNRAFTRALGRALHRPTVLPIPRLALATALGAELVDEALLASQRVVPARLQADGFAFRHPELEGALSAALAA